MCGKKKPKKLYAVLNNRVFTSPFHSTAVKKMIGIHHLFNQELRIYTRRSLTTTLKAILTAIGGFNVNQILEHIDYEIIRQHPKILCGYSDITALLNAVYAKTGLITYHGAHFSTFGFDIEAGIYAKSIL